MAQTVNEKLAAEAVRRRIMLIRYGNQQAQELIKALRNQRARLIIALLDGTDGMTASNMTPARVVRLTNSTLKTATGVYSDIWDLINRNLKSYGNAELDYHQNTLAKAIPDPVWQALKGKAERASWQQLLATVNSKAVQGQTIEKWFNKKLPEDTTTSLINAVRTGILQGTPTVQVVNEIKNGAAWANSERNLATITHTAINYVAADARELTRQANEDLIKERQWLSTLDNKTSQLCIVRDGLRYTAEEEPKPIGHNIPYGAGPGRLHFRCRSTETWVTKSWRELGINVDELPEGTRASMNGQVPSSMNYMQWLQEKASSRVQEEVLGVMRADMLRSGKFKVADFYDDGKMIPLSKLLELDKRDGL